MSQFRFAVKIGIVLLVVALLHVPVAADGDGAIVWNHGDGCDAEFTVDGALYSGPATLVWTPNGKIRGQANMRLVSGTPVKKTTHMTVPAAVEGGEVLFYARIVLTPSGNANVHFFD